METVLYCSNLGVHLNEVNAKTNVVIAAFTTCHARLKLYEVLERLGDRAFYQDTGRSIDL